MRLTRFGFCLGVGLLLCVPSPVATQQQQLTFKASTALVEVDVIVQDRKGEFVPGLVAEDLQLFEEGRPQKIEQFYMVTHERGGQLFPVTGDAQVAPEDRARRIFVVLFDEAHMDHEGLGTRLWGKARDYLEPSLRLAARPDTCAELARLCEHLGETEQSRALLARAVRASVGELPALPMPGR